MWTFHKSESGGTKCTAGTNKKRQRTRMALIWIERILLICGVGLAAFYGAARIEGLLSSRAALKEFATKMSADRGGDDRDQKASLETAASFPESELPSVDFSQWGESRVKAYKQSASKQSGGALAVLHIPKIRLEAPIFEGTGDLTLNHGLGRIVGTAHVGESGNIGIAGHRDGFFRGLKDVGVGDAIEVKRLEGTDTYVVDEIKIVAPTQVEVLQSSSVPMLTLVTCYPFYFVGSAPQRYIVTASLLSEKNGGVGFSESGPPSATNNSIRRKHMNIFGKKINWLNKGAGVIALAMLALGTVAAQDSTVTTVQHGEPSFETQVKNAEVVYAEGNDLVLKLENGGVEHLVVPDSDKFTIDGKDVSVHELVPGTKLTQTIITSSTPRYVNSVRTIEGKVWHVNAPRSVILNLPDNSNQVFRVPSHATFTVNGEKKTVFDLRKGMKLKATIVTDEEHTIVESNKLAFGNAPKPSTPREVGVLLFLAPPQPQVALASAEQPVELPATGSSLPLVGLAGGLAIAMALAVRAVRQTRGV